MDRTLKIKMQLVGVVLPCLFGLQGCLPIQKNSSGEKFGKKNCCESCQSEKKVQGISQAPAISNSAYPAQNKVIPDEVNAGNYQKMLKTLEEEVTQSGTNP